jgi:hypothetical protein
MSPTFDFNVKNENLRKCRIVAEFISKTRFANFFMFFRRIAHLGSKIQVAPRVIEYMTKRNFKISKNYYQEIS